MRISVQGGIVKLIKFGVWLIRKWRKEIDWTRREERLDRESWYVLKWANACHKESSYPWRLFSTSMRTEQGTTDLKDSRGLLVKYQEKLYEESNNLLQKFMISLGKQPLEWYGLLRQWPLETSLGVRSSRRGWRGGRKHSLTLFLTLEEYGFCCWVSRWGENEKDCPLAYWERKWKAGSQGKGLNSAVLLSYATNFCNWNDKMNV